MVEHMSAQTKQPQPPPEHHQSFNGLQASHHWYRDSAQQQHHHHPHPHHQSHHRHNHHRSSHPPHQHSPPHDSAGVTKDNSSTGNNNRFSLLRWFRRRDPIPSSSLNHKRYLFRRNKRRPSTSSSSSSSSTDTLYSTATVRSFAFHSGGTRRRAAEDALLPLEHSSSAVGPFAPGAVKLVEKRGYRGDVLRDINSSTTLTLPSGFSQRQDIQTRYSLLPARNPFVSCDSIPIADRRPRAFADVRRNVNHNGNGTLQSDSSLSGRRKVHVKGKRRAPDPPDRQIEGSVHVAGGPRAGGGGGSGPVTRGRRKRRPAPKPPGYSETLSSNQGTLSSEASTGMEPSLITKDHQTISNDTLVLRRGVLLSKRDSLLSNKSRISGASVSDSEASVVSNNKAIVPVRNIGSSTTKVNAIMPRPWYKRNVFNEHTTNGSRDSLSNVRRGDVLRGVPLPIEAKDECVSNCTSAISPSSLPVEGSLSRLGFFHRDKRHQEDGKKKENKRKSGVSILTNISELDKEAAAIVREEQARNRASMILQAAKMDEEFDRRMGANQEIVQEIVNSSMENSPRRSARALISKFNALGNIAKVNVNANFLAKSNNSASPKNKNKRFSQECSNNFRDYSPDHRAVTDLSKYFYPQQSASKTNSIFSDVIQPCRPTIVVATSKIDPPRPMPTSSTPQSIVTELDEMAIGIDRLRRKLNDRPKMMDKIDLDRDKIIGQKKEVSAIVNDVKDSVKDKELTHFNKEFTRIFDELDRQHKDRDSNSAASSRAIANESSISNQVQKVIDILVTVDKDAVSSKNIPQFLKGTKPSARDVLEKKESTPNKEITSTARISGIDDKTTAELKEMLKEMKHSLPKRSNHKARPELKVNSEQKEIERIASTSPYRAVEEINASPKVSTKVSSGVQTSGNVRKIVNETSSVAANIRIRENDVSNMNPSPKTNVYQLIKANEFAQIEALKTKTSLDNAYGNVMGKYLDANISSHGSADKLTERKKQESNAACKTDLLSEDNRKSAALVLPLPETNGNPVDKKNNSFEEGK